MANETPATRALAQAGISFSIRRYDYDPAAESIGLAAAEALGEHPSRVLKTLMVHVDGRAVCVILSSNHQASMKLLAAAASGKSATMMSSAEAERTTGYKAGGISPLGQRKAVPTFLDAAVAAEDQIFINGGQRGLQIRITPSDLIAATSARLAAIRAD
jgi:Cys-tRNA(Pro)/Cys-tRNA(Cys) deacylase